MKKIIFSILGVLAILIAGLIIFVFATWNRNYEAPLPDIKASNDSTIIARGKYLAFGPAHCSACHVPMDKILEVENGLEIPLSGGWELSIPLGTFRAPNLTPDMETGIGKFTDAEIARTLRYSVSHDNKFVFPFMPFQGLSDYDLTAIISFLRSQEAINNNVKRTEYEFLGKALLAFEIVKPIAPINDPPKVVIKDSTIKYGSYIANNVANCIGCHTERDLKSGAFIGPYFAGGMKFEPDGFSKGYAFVSPNLTPDKETGVISEWDEETFIARFQEGRVLNETPMPWGAYSRMDEIELKALYRYFMSLDPIIRKVEKTIYLPGEELQ